MSRSVWPSIFSLLTFKFCCTCIPILDIFFTFIPPFDTTVVEHIKEDHDNSRFTTTILLLQAPATVVESKAAVPLLKEMLASALLVEQDDAADADLLLQEFDFPENYVNMAHPEDGTVTSTPITPEFIRHSRRGHFRMLVRFSLRLGDDRFAPYTFVCDTGAPIHIYLSEPAMSLLEAAGRIETDELGSLFITIAGRKAAIRVTPHSHQPGNILGMLLLERFGLQMREGSFTFSSPVPYL